MQRRFAVLTLLGAWLIAAGTLSAGDSPKSGSAGFVWKDGDKVALIGGTVIEREQNYGQWEAALTRNIPAKNVTFRNLGWSGDTVWAESRGIFEPAERGYALLIDLVKEQKPSVLVFGYGQVEAIEGPARLPAFIEQYERMVNDCKAGSAEGVRVILLGPMDLVQMPAPLPSVAGYNALIATYRQAIQEFAAKIGATYVPLSMPTAGSAKELRLLTDNGQHLSSEGYARTASQLVSALTPGKAKELKTGDADSLLQLIRKKNELFFHRYRPQNVTYLFLFRKHEQGNNAVDIPKFDPLVKGLEEQIHAAVD
ncbi:MAG: GDSL-type esterase/lipase family protein [Planctomycetaceae bacterium]